MHDGIIANIYFQEFNERFKYGEIIADVPVAKNDYASMKQGDTLHYNVLDNDEITGAVNVAITRGPNNGEAEVESSGLATYVPDQAFTGLDTVVYRVCSASNNAYCDSAKLIILVEKPSYIPSLNPSGGEFVLYNHSSESGLNVMEVFSMSGKRVYSSQIVMQLGPNQISLPNSVRKGLYLIRISDTHSVTQLKLLLQ